ncbi:MAG: PD-(D/E)XK nuclease family protein [Patescibacteria group bacterium]|jgi:CRISPR/Cas system-associated exonuclease Cas4 (RecB family)
MPIQLSPYKLTMYKNCPKQYFFYNDPNIRNKYKKDQPYFTMGTNVHQALHDIFALVPSEERNLEKLSYLLRLIWTKNRKGFKDTDEEARYGNKAIRQLQQFAIKDNLKKEPLFIEEMHKISLDNDQVIFLGKIDRIDELEDGSIHIIDYKTGKLSDEDPDFDQLYYYGFIASKKIDHPISKASYLYLEDYYWIDKEISKSDIERVEKNIINQAKKIINDKEFTPCPNKFCKNCDYLEICPKKVEAMTFLSAEKSDPLPF